MVLDKHRASLDWWLVPLAKALRGVNPNTITWISLVAAIGSGVAFYYSGPDQIGLLLLAAILVVTNGVLDVLDGKIAQVTGKMTPKGDYLDHCVDRFSDVAILAGLAFSPWVDIRLGLAAIIGTLLTSYLGTQGQAVGLGRNYGGMLGRADRLVLIMVVPFLQAAFPRYGPPGGLWAFHSILDLMMAYFAIVGLATVVQRFARGLRAFDAEGQIK